MGVIAKFGTKKAKKDFVKSSAGVGGPGGIIVAGKRLLPGTKAFNFISTSTVTLRKGIAGKRAILPSRLKPKKMAPNEFGQQKPFSEARSAKVEAIDVEQRIGRVLQKEHFSKEEVIQKTATDAFIKRAKISAAKRKQ